MLRGSGSGLLRRCACCCSSFPVNSTFGLMRFYRPHPRRPIRVRRAVLQPITSADAVALDRHPHVVLPVPAQSDVDRSADHSAYDRRCCGFRDEAS
ncbi:MAG: hypothetical protein ACLR4Z_06530 [Butyricicoccaceae bacterium]